MRNKKIWINIAIILVALMFFTFEFTVQTNGIQKYAIGTTLVENGNDVAWRNSSNTETTGGEVKNGKLLTHIELPAKIGKEYKEELAVKNSGGIEEYVRVTVYIYWIDEDGNKDSSLDPKKIEIDFSQNPDWIIDEDATTTQRTVLFYRQVLGEGDTTPTFINTIKLNDTIKETIQFSEQAAEGNTTIITHSKNTFEGKTATLEVNVDAVQNHNAQDAIETAWGRKVSIDSNGTLSLM